MYPYFPRKKFEVRVGQMRTAVYNPVPLYYHLIPLYNNTRMEFVSKNNTPQNVVTLGTVPSLIRSAAIPLNVVTITFGDAAEGRSNLDFDLPKGTTPRFPFAETVYWPK